MILLLGLAFLPTKLRVLMRKNMLFLRKNVEKDFKVAKFHVLPPSFKAVSEEGEKLEGLISVQSLLKGGSFLYPSLFEPLYQLYEALENPLSNFGVSMENFKLMKIKFQS